MLAALCAITALIQTDQEYAWQRQTLDNGSAVIAQNLPNAKTVSIQLFAAARGVQETPQTHGLRHLLEHIIAKGPAKDLDRRIESKGLFLTAETYRDAMQFEVRCTPGQIGDAMKTISELLQPIKVTQDEIDKEVKILAQEFALKSDSLRLSEAAWTLAYGDEGLSPLGNLETMAKATPEALLQLQRSHFRSTNIIISIAGPIPEREAIGMGSKLLELPKGTEADWVRRGEGRSARGDAETAHGSVRGARVERYSDAITAWTIAAGFGIATEFEDGFFIYTPSIQNGIVLVGSVKDRDFGSKIDGMSETDARGLFAQGRLNARAWIHGQLSTPSGAAFLRGYIGCQAYGGRPEQILENLKTMTVSEFMQGYARFKSAEAVSAIGGRN